MPLNAISAIGGSSDVTGSSGVTGVTGVTGVAGVGSVGSAGAGEQTGAGSAFDTVLGAVDTVQGLQSTSSTLAVKAVTGTLTDVHDYTIAAAEAATAIELTAAVRNKAVEAFSEIMRMQA